MGGRMSSKHRFPAFTALIGIILATAVAAPAHATTFCVPGYSETCPNSGGNVAQPNLETAVNTNASDGNPDRVLVGPMTFTDPTVFAADGSDNLEIVGSGPSLTRITTANTTGFFTVDFTGANQVTMRDLTVEVPAAQVNGSGGGIAMRGDVMENVTIETRNPGATGILAQGGGAFREGSIIGVSGGNFSFGASTLSGESGLFTITGSLIRNALKAVYSEFPEVPIAIRDSFLFPTGNGLFSAVGSKMTVDNSVIEAGSNAAIRVVNGPAASPLITVRHSTIVNHGDQSKVALELEAFNGASFTSSIDFVVSDSIIRGFDTPFSRTAPVSGAGRNANLTIKGSNFSPVGVSVGNGSLDIAGSGNINADPLFTDTFDYRLLEGSPSIDTGGSGPALDTDLNGAQRALDGDGDGVAVADQGAFEFSLPAPPPPDTTGPRISGVKFRAPREGARILKISVDEAGRVTAVFKPLPKRSHGRKRKTLKLSESFSSPGFTKFIIPRSQLKKGKYRLFVSAVDESGNKASKPRRIVRVKR